FFSSRRRHTRSKRDWSSDVCSSDLHDKGVATYIAGNSGAAPDRTLENEYTDILNIGKIFHVEDKAEALVEEMKAAVADTLAAVRSEERRVGKDGRWRWGQQTEKGEG